MTRSSTSIKVVAFLIMLGIPIIFAPDVLAQSSSGEVAQIENFIRSIIKVIASLAGLIATGFLVAGGFTYITSSGNPEHLDRGKRTIMYALIGLAITIGAFVLSNIVAGLATNAFGG